MKFFKAAIFYGVIGISVLVILASLLSLIHDIPYWYYKVLDFPRLQFLILALICLATFMLINRRWRFASVFLALGLTAAVFIQTSRILPYLVGEKTVPDWQQKVVNQKNAVGIMIANVLITNRQAEEFMQIVGKTSPQMLLVMEVNQWWIDQLEPLKKEYPYVMEYPTDNAYGMALYSKLPLEDPSIMFLKHQDVPSFHAKVRLPSGEIFMFHGVHPVAPVPSDQYPDNVGEEEVALLIIGEMVARDSIPAVVAGDFNDVSWSYTSRLFEGKGDLRNVRLGRGLYNSYNAQSYVQRWPLDHFFVTKEFALIELKRLSKFQSDHFPLFAKLVLEK